MKESPLYLFLKNLDSIPCSIKFKVSGYIIHDPFAQPDTGSKVYIVDMARRQDLSWNIPKFVAPALVRRVITHLVSLIGDNAGILANW